MRARALAVAWLALSPMPAAAIDVNTDPYAPKVVIRNSDRTSDHHNYEGRRVDSNSNPRSTTPINLCLSGDTVNSCGEPRDHEETSDEGTVITPGMAAEAVSEVPMPSLELHVQPDGQTLVNVDTIFFAEPKVFKTSIELLGVTVDIEARPVRFTWVHGDGTKQTTTTPGRAYPSKDVTHRYLRPGSAPAQVDTTYAVRFAIDDGDWIELGDQLTASGESTAVEVREALPVLVH
jgi:hypothetical protein